MKRVFPLVLLLIAALVVPMYAQTWNFETPGNAEGWTRSLSVNTWVVANGCMSGNVIGNDPFIITTTALAINALANPYIHIRMRSNAGAEGYIWWTTTTKPAFDGAKRLNFYIIPDGQFHDYIITMTKSAEWTGAVSKLRINPGNTSSGTFAIDFIHVVPVVPAILQISAPSPSKRYMTVGEQSNISVTVKNTGQSAASNLSATLGVAGQSVLSRQPLTFATLGPGQEQTLTWQIKALAPALSKMTAAVGSQDPGGTISASAPLIVAGTRPAMVPGTTPAGTWKDGAGNYFIGNSRVRMAFYKGTYGYGISELYVRAGTVWKLMGSTCPLSRVSYMAGGNMVNLAITPQTVTTGRQDGRAVLAFSFNHPDNFEGVWTGSITFSLGEGEDVVKASYTLKSSQPRDVIAWVGPSLCPGDHAFGSLKSQALFPGLEWLIGGERSSTMLESPAAFANRSVPHPYKITVPLMALSYGGSVAGILWNALQTWDGSNAYPSAKFASPNWIENQQNHLMELFAPSVPGWVNESTTQAATPYPLASGGQLSMECYYLARQGEVLDAVLRWYQLFGMLPMPGGDGLLEQGLLTAREGLMNTVWDPVQVGWAHFYGRMVKPAPEFAQDLFADSLTETDPVEKAALRARVDQVVQKVISQSGPAGLASGDHSNLPGVRLPYFVGHISEMMASCIGDATAIRSTRQPDGSWFVVVDPDHPELTTPNTTELGTCAQRNYNLIRYGRILGDGTMTADGLAGLEYMKRFPIPRGSLTVEVPQHAPEMVAATWAMAAYLEAFELTSNRDHLARAMYWARACLPFVYTWCAPDRPIMGYATIPAYGCSMFLMPWFGRPVQWCGFVFAYHVLKLAEYDNTFPWRTLAEGITRSGVMQMNASPYPGVYPDSFSILYSYEPNLPYVNPDNLYKAARQLLGRWGEVDVRHIKGPTRNAYISTGGKFHLGCWDNYGQRLYLKLKYQPGETCHTLVMNAPNPIAVYKGSTPLGKAVDVDNVEEGWMYNMWDKRVVLKTVQQGETDTITLVYSGSFQAEQDVIGPAYAKTKPIGTTVSFKGTILAGAKHTSTNTFVKQLGGTAWIRVALPKPILFPFKPGDTVEVMGTLTRDPVTTDRYLMWSEVKKL